MAFTYRLEKGSPLTEYELDENFRTVANIAQTTADEINKKVTADTNEAKKQAAEAKKQADAAKAEADRASQITGLDTVADAIGLAAVPFPDVWIPFNDSLRMFAGYGREVKVGDDVVARMVNFERSTIATYTDKSGVLRTAAINEPRFEKQGLLIEGRSTNLIPWSEPTSPQPGLTSVGRMVASYNQDGVINFTVNDTSTGTCWCQVNATVSALSANDALTGSLFASVSVPGNYRLNLVSAGGSIGSSVIVYLDSTPRRISVSASGLALGGGDMVSVRLSKDSGVVIGEMISITKCQLEQLPFMSSYIKTAGSAVTRSTDLCWLESIGNIPKLNGVGTGMTIHLTFSPLGWSMLDNYIVYFGQSVGDKRWGVSKTPNLDRITSSGFGGTVSAQYTNPDKISICARWDAGSNSISCSVNGNINTNSNIGDGRLIMSTLLSIGSRDRVAASSIFGHIRDLKIWHHALSDAQIKGLK